MMRYSLLDVSPVIEGGDAALAFRNTVDLAQHADRWGYHRFWLAEHHNLPGIASAATAVVIGHVAGVTQRMRVGAGGIMLPNHAPLVIAEQFGTLEAMYPRRIDLGLGRAPGSDHATARALRRKLGNSSDSFPQDVLELQAYFSGESGRVTAVPGAGLRVPLYLLGSSDFSAQLAAQLGLPFAFASHFAPDYLRVALEIYRSEFRPSAQLSQPYVIVGAAVYAAATEEAARRLFTSAQLAVLRMIRGRPTKLPPPVASMEGLWSAEERAAIEHRTQYSAVGTAAVVREHLERLLDETRADEVILMSQIFDHAARLRSFEIAAEVLQELGAAPD